MVTRFRPTTVMAFVSTLVQVASVAKADVKLPHIFSDHMVLQADQPVRIWGQAEPNENVEVRFSSQVAKATASKQGKWQITLPALTASFQPQTLSVKGHNELLFQDVLVGEVWLASGQSNMEWKLIDADGGHDAVATSSDEGLRLFAVAHPDKLPATPTDVEGQWAVSGPSTSSEFSAVGFFFGRHLRKALARPVGIIDTSWGGTPVEAWTSREALSRNVEGRYILRRQQGMKPKTPEQDAADLKAYESAHAVWERTNLYTDPGIESEAQGFSRPGIPQAGWEKKNMPAHWEDVGLQGDGAVWFRKDFQVPQQWVGQELELHLGVLNDCDTIFINASKVGESCAHTPDTHRKPRMVRIPGALVKPGLLLVAVRVFDERGNGGFSSPAESLFVQPVAGGTRMSLAGAWNMRQEKLLATMNPRWDLEPQRPVGYPHPNAAHALWDAFVAPLAPYAIKGAIWYQGESNAARAVQYRTLFPAMIVDWRQRWNQGSFPFYFVQLAGYRATGHPAEWPELREAQTIALKLPQTGMAVAIDIGNPNDIHPKNKLAVAERLARWALGKTYGQPLVVSGPLYKRMKVETKGIRLWFDHAQGLRVAPGEATLRAFEIAGADRKFHPGEAVIEAETVVVSARGISRPAAVRYGWDGAPPCNLQNAEGLPASPFRTDSWPEVTKGRH